MALENIHLRKFLKIAFAEPNKRRSELRADIRNDLRREAGDNSGGGDFYTPFWSDAKGHVFDGIDLRTSTDGRINANDRRGNLYPQLRDGFLDWWDQKRRWTNQPFRPGRKLKGRYYFPEFDATVKVENIMSVVDGVGDERAVYHYSFPQPPMNLDMARIGLWIMSRALPDVPKEELRILDVIRGNTFSFERTPLTGEEELEFNARFARLVRVRDELRADYD